MKTRIAAQNALTSFTTRPNGSWYISPHEVMHDGEKVRPHCRLWMDFMRSEKEQKNVEAVARVCYILTMLTEAPQDFFAARPTRRRRSLPRSTGTCAMPPSPGT